MQNNITYRNKCFRNQSGIIEESCVMYREVCPVSEKESSVVAIGIYLIVCAKDFAQHLTSIYFYLTKTPWK